MLILLKFKEPDDAFSTSTQIENLAFLRPTLKTMSLFIHSGTRAGMRGRIKLRWQRQRQNSRDSLNE